MVATVTLSALVGAVACGLAQVTDVRWPAAFASDIDSATGLPVGDPALTPTPTGAMSTAVRDPPTVAVTWDVFASLRGLGSAREQTVWGAWMTVRLDVDDRSPGTVAVSVGTVIAWLPEKSRAEPAIRSMTLTEALMPRVAAVSACRSLPTSTSPRVETAIASCSRTEASTVLPPVLSTVPAAR